MRTHKKLLLGKGFIMGFNDLVVTLAKKHSLPEMAALQLNDLLSEDVKKRIV